MNTVNFGSVKYAELLQTLTTSDIQFLSNLSLLRTFTISDAAEVTRHPDCERRFSILLNAGAIKQVSDSPKTYQLSNFVHDVCREKLSEDIQQLKKVAEVSAILSEKKELMLQALELYALADNTEKTIQLATENLQHLVYQADIDLLTKWGPVISKALNAGKPGEKIILAYGLYATGQHDRLRATLRELESLDMSDQVGQAISHESELLRIRLEFTYGHYSRVSQMTDQLTAPNTAIYGRAENTHFSLYRNVLSALFYQQDYEKFSQYYEKVASGFSANSSPIGHVSINTFKAMNAFLQGAYIDANEYALAAVQLAEEYGVEGSYFPFEAGYILMDTNLEFAEVEKSQGYVDKYLEYALACKQYTAIVAYFSKASLIQLQAGNVSGALALIRKGREKIDSPLFSQEISFVLDAHELIIRMALGESERIAELIPRIGNHKLIDQFKLAMELQRNPADADKTLQLFPTDTVREKFYKEYMSAMVFESKGPQAIIHLERAIEIAIPNGYFRSFLLSSPTLKNYLLDIASRKPTVYLENLARAIRDQSQVQSKAGSVGSSSLTKRELDILRRLATGIPISQIAASVHISQNTIKTHLKNLYRKMNVESRDEAVERGKELSLL